MIQGALNAGHQAVAFVDMIWPIVGCRSNKLCLAMLAGDRGPQVGGTDLNSSSTGRARLSESNRNARGHDWIPLCDDEISEGRIITLDSWLGKSPNRRNPAGAITTAHRATLEFTAFPQNCRPTEHKMRERSPTTERRKIFPTWVDL